MKKIKGILVMLLLIFIDQITKILAIKHLKDQKPLTIIKDVFSLQYLENTGAAFGIFQNKILFFTILTAIVLIFMGYIYTKTPDTKRYVFFRLTLILLTAGAIGNFIDRLFRKYVVDFFYFELINFPIFNVADCYVTVSAFILLLLFLFYYKEDDFSFLNFKKSDRKDD